MAAKKQLVWLNHAAYAVRGLEEPLEACEVGEVGASALRPPQHASGQRVTLDGESVLGWRPAIGLLIPGTRWRLEEKLGEGGFGEVWLAQDETLKHKQRVFKFCFRSDRARSLKREAALFRLLRDHVRSHANIVAIHEINLDEPPFYLGMDYVAGRDLSRWWKQSEPVRRVPLETRFEIAAQVADALDAAHRAGILHRDVKPSNILIEAKGTEPGDVAVKLTDFGIGQVMADELLSNSNRAGFTQTMLNPTLSMQAGTYLYMAPELFIDQKASPQSDLLIRP